MDANTTVTLTDDVRDALVRRKVTCPFLGSAVHQSFLAVRGDANNPLASIEDVRRLGNSGGGDLGDLLVMFASGNHAFMRGNDGKLSAKAPDGLFSLELPGSQGSHPGHSGILQGDPETLDSGRVSEADFARLANRAKGGFIKRSDFGGFIAENLLRDPKSKVFELSAAELLLGDVEALVGTIGGSLGTILAGSGDDAAAARRTAQEKLTKTLGENNLLGSSGEFGLLFAFLINKPGLSQIDGEPALPLEDVRGMFLDMTLPTGWQSWKKRIVDWVAHTTALASSAAKEFHAQKRNAS
jgi:hypothetical protein